MVLPNGLSVRPPKMMSRILPSAPTLTWTVAGELSSSSDPVDTVPLVVCTSPTSPWSIRLPFRFLLGMGVSRSDVLDLEEDARHRLDLVEQVVDAVHRRGGDRVGERAQDERAIGVTLGEGHQHLHPGLEREMEAVVGPR